MFQDGQASPTPLASPPPLHQNPFASASRLLQVVLLAFDKHGDRDKEKDRYAAIRFPQTYEEAIAGIEQNLGEYLLSGTADAVDMFCQMENADRQLIWAKFDRADWELARQHLLPVVYRTRALGIRQQHCFQRGAVVKSLFVRGPITITHGDRESGVSRWTSATPSRYNQTDRPGSYDEAVKAIHGMVLANPAVWPSLYTLFRGLAFWKLRFRFHYFISDQSQGPNTRLWVDFPPDAMSDEEVWRAVVPRPHQMLGFTVSELAPHQCSG
ncbi:hypothetical protein BJ912DRAFT_1005043 [Pholiota molesta]|nr:hypothetical protein BJ912DRAFT_1005043 [Pholiota molesta]